MSKLQSTSAQPCKVRSQAWLNDAALCVGQQHGPTISMVVVTYRCGSACMASTPAWCAVTHSARLSRRTTTNVCMVSCSRGARARARATITKRIGYRSALVWRRSQTASCAKRFLAFQPSTLCTKSMGTSSSPEARNASIHITVWHRRGRHPCRPQRLSSTSAACAQSMAIVSIEAALQEGDGVICTAPGLARWLPTAQ